MGLVLDGRHTESKDDILAGGRQEVYGLPVCSAAPGGLQTWTPESHQSHLPGWTGHACASTPVQQAI